MMRSAAKTARNAGAARTIGRAFAAIGPRGVARSAIAAMIDDGAKAAPFRAALRMAGDG